MVRGTQRTITIPIETRGGEEIQAQLSGVFADTFQRSVSRLEIGDVGHEDGAELIVGDWLRTGVDGNRSMTSNRGLPAILTEEVMVARRR
ncbi:hypothetical protein I6F26_28440 [Ensifer sp. IC3342]|nr:hypothetical protein [Ensifer sp. BRP08]MCA1450477.1 hypothetical protein [Ensifer sp. IC3342]